MRVLMATHGCALWMIQKFASNVDYKSLDTIEYHSRPTFVTFNGKENTSWRDIVFYTIDKLESLCNPDKQIEKTCYAQTTLSCIL